jgi:TolB-like protein/class 3 adenylate cyclase
MSTTRRLAAILAADVVGYSRLVSADEAGALSQLAALRRDIIEPNFAKHSGRLFKVMGDGFLVEFASAVQAVTCAIAIQTEAEQAAAALDDTKRMRLRIGIHVGDVMVEGDDLMGDGVNIASRLESIAAPGGVSVSRAVHDQVRDRMAVAFDDKGEIALKNIARPVQVFALGGGKDARAAAIGGSIPALTLPDKPSIAVLPFQNMSGDPEQEYFADGMVEDIITALSRFKSLFVIARNSSFTYKGRAVDTRQVGRELGVQYVLEGSVRRIGEKVRITTQLIDAVSGSHAWADRFDGTLHDVFELQDSVTARVVGFIAPKLIEAEIETVSRKPIENWSSYDYYLRGQRLFHEGNRGQVQATRDALEIFRKVVDLDPTVGRAYARVANCIQSIRDLHGYPISEDERIEALRCAETAVELSGDDEVPLANLAYVFGMLKGDYERGLELADRALALNPNHSHAWTARGIMSVILGRHEQALDALAKAMRLNPIDKVAVPLALFGMAAACSLLERYEEGAGFARKVLVLQPKDIRGLFTLTSNTYLSGQITEAEATAAQIKQCHPHLRSSHLRQSFRVERATDMVAVERTIEFIGLPD